MKRIRSRLVLAAALLLWPVVGFAGDAITGSARVIDGDTLKIGTTTIRLFGIDAPEGKQSCKRDGIDWLCGQEAAKALREHVAGRDLSCEARDRDRYKRVVAVCSIEGEDVNRWLVVEGWALAYRQYSKAYVIDEETARDARRGLWAGEFKKPWEWRLQKKRPLP